MRRKLFRVAWVMKEKYRIVRREWWRRGKWVLEWTRGSLLLQISERLMADRFCIYFELSQLKLTWLGSHGTWSIRGEITKRQKLLTDCRSENRSQLPM